MMGKTKVMIVEDERVIARDIQLSLEELGYAVAAVAASGAEALQLVHTAHPDVVLMDIQLGAGLDGIETATRLRAEYDLPIIYLTAHSDENTLQRAKATAPASYILKPFRERDLYTSIEMTLQMHELTQKLREHEISLRWRNQELTTLNDIIASLTATLELQQVLQRIVQAAAELLPQTANATIQMWDDPTEKLITQTTLQTPASMTVDFRVGEGIAGWAMLERQLVNIPDVTAEPRFVANPHGAAFSSLLVVPLIFGTQFLGTLSLNSTAIAAFAADDEWLAQLLARAAAIAIANARLVAALRESETQLRDYNLNLEQLVSARTVALQEAHQQLIHSEKLASLGRMAATIVHEIGNPLATIGSFLDLLWENTPPEHPDRELREAVCESLQRLTDLLCQLRDFSRPPTHDRVPTALNLAVERVLTLTSKQLTRNKIEIVRDLPFHIPYVNASASELEQVFLNLVINAVDAMPNGGKLTVRTYYQDGRVRVEFADTGSGIAPEIMNQIFEPFFTTKGENGTGLGLAISHRLINEHGGDIRVTSRVGQGSTFTVELPAMN